MRRFSPPFLPPLTELLSLEELDRDLYRGINEFPDNGFTALYGGQVAAQALMAAGMTVSPDRHPHSMHGYFLRTGRRDRPVVFQVDRDRDGRSFSSRRVAALQDGEVIFDLAASFHVERDGGTVLPARPQITVAPEDCEPDPYVGNVPCADSRSIPPLVTNGFGHVTSNRLWVRTAQRLPDDPLIHRCALTYLSDIGTGFNNYEIHGLPAGGASLDHAMWFRDHLRADEWMVLDLDPMMAGGSRGLYQGSLHSADGRLGAMLTQEVLLMEGRRTQPQ